MIDVEYAPLPAVVDARHALDADAPRVRDKPDNHVFDWEAGDAAATDAVFAAAEHVSACDLVYPRVHPAPLETCGVVADHDPVTDKLTVYATAQAPHAHRVLLSRVTGIPEHRIRIVAPDIGGGFGNKVGLYPGYVCAVVASGMVGAPVKWVEDRSENLMATAFARDYHMRGEIAATSDGRITGLRVRVLADHGAFNATAQPSRFPAGFFHTFTGSYDVPAAHCRVTGVHTNKAPGGVAYACSFRVTEASYLVERLVDVLAYDLGLDPAELRMRNLLRPEQFPYRCATGWEYDSGDYPRTLALALEMAGYEELRKEQAARQAAGDGPLLGIGISFFTEAVGAGPRALMDIAGLGMADGAQLRVHPTGSAVLAVSCMSQGQGHETTFAQLVAHELGIGVDEVEVVQGDTDRTPFGLGTYGSRSTPVSGAAARWSRRARCGNGRGWSRRRCWRWRRRTWSGSRGASRCAACPATGASFREIALAAHSDLELPDGVEGHLDAMAVYNPPNLTFPCGAYVCVVDVDPGTGEVVVRRFVAVDDCGVRINPTIVEGQIHGGLADGIGMALMELIAFDRAGNHLGASFMDYLLPTALECPMWELGETVTPSPHHPVGAKGVGESATVGSPAAVVNAVLDAIGVRHADMPLTPAQVWRACQGRPMRPDLAIGDE